MEPLSMRAEAALASAQDAFCDIAELAIRDGNPVVENLSEAIYAAISAWLREMYSRTRTEAK